MKFERIKNLREDNDLSQESLAEILNIPQRTYSNYETGARTIPFDILIMIADYYDVSIDYLLNRTNDKRRFK